MNAMQTLIAARAAGISVALDGDRLALEASAPPTPEVFEALSRHKPEIMALLRTTKDGRSAEDWQVFFD